MYNVSQDYITAESKAVKQFKLRGKCCGKDFTDADILSGSFTVTNQCSSPSEITLGAVYIGQLTATFFDTLNIQRTEWVGGTITVQAGLKLASGFYEFIPIGIYTIAEAKHARSGIEVVAYDNMSKLDRELDFDATYGTVYELLSAFCLACGVELGMTRAEVEALPNGTRTLGIYSDNDCQTYRDFVSNLAAVCCCFATAGRDGKIYLRPFNGISVASFDSADRFTGCKFSDYVTSYAGVTVANVQEGGIDAYSNGNRGVMLDLGENPFLQYGLDEMLSEVGQSIATALIDTAFTPFEATLLCGAEYDLGDVLTMTEGTAGDSSTCFIHSMAWTFNRGCTIKGVGSNPDVGTAKSKYDKMISGMRQSASNEIKYYAFTNAAPYEIADGEEEMLMYINFATVKQGYVVFQAEIHAEVSGEITFTYKLNGADMNFVPIEQYDASQDNHIISLFYPFLSNGNTTYELELWAEMNGGSCDIAVNDVRALLWGQGLAANDTWTGILRFEEELSPMALVDMGVATIADVMTFVTKNPTEEGFAESVGAVALLDLGFVSNISTGLYINRDSASDYTWNEFSAICDDWADAIRFDW